MILDGDVPIGAGLPSSAAVECATIFALNELFQLNISRLEMAKLTQMPEHTFAGVRCGIMVMYASLFGKKGNVIQLDCKTLKSEYFHFDFDDYSILLMDTKIKHSLASSEYNQHRQQSEEGVAAIQKKYTHVNSLMDAIMQMLNEIVNEDDIVCLRCKYVIEENERLLLGCQDLKQNDIKAFGKKMFATHIGLSKEYEVSCPEMDFLVTEALANNNIARQQDDRRWLWRLHN